MNVTTENEALLELYTTGKSDDKRYKKLPKSTISGFVKAVNLIKNAKRIEDLFQHKGLNYEKLGGNLKDYESVRCDRKYRLMFKSSVLDNTIVITEVELFEITDHYGSL